MALVAKRMSTETWRAAVARRAAERGLESPCVAHFDALVAEGRPEAEAAYVALETAGCLSSVDLPGDPTQAEIDQIEPEGS